MNLNELAADPPLYEKARKWAQWPGAPKNWPDTRQPISWGELAEVIGSEMRLAVRMYHAEHTYLAERAPVSQQHADHLRRARLAEEMLDLIAVRGADDAIAYHRMPPLSTLAAADYADRLSHADASASADLEAVRRVCNDWKAMAEAFEVSLPERNTRQRQRARPDHRGYQHLIHGTIDIWTKSLQQEFGPLPKQNFSAHFKDLFNDLLLLVKRKVEVDRLDEILRDFKRRGSNGFSTD